MPCSSRKRAFSLVEVLVCLVLLSLALVPIFNLFISSNRMGHAARRMVDASVYGQTILEGLSQLGPDDLPPLAPDTEVILLDGDQAASGGGPRFAQVQAHFKKSVPFEMQERVVSARRSRSGELLLRAELKWLAVVSDERTGQSASLTVLTAPKAWR